MTKCILEIQVQKYKRWLFNLKDVIIFLNPSLRFGCLNASGLIKLCHQEVYRTTVMKEKVNSWAWAAGAQMYTNTGTHFSFNFQMNSVDTQGWGFFIDCSFVVIWGGV